MKTAVKRILATFCMCACSLAAAFSVPGKPVRIIVGVPPGGGTDVSARLVAERLQSLSGVPVLVENRPGAAFMIAAQEVARAAPDGHTLLYTPDSVLTLLPHVTEKLGYDPARSFTPISLGARGAIALVAHASLPAANVQELVAYARARPGELSFASAGTATPFHLYGEMLKQQAGLDMVHIPYKGAGDVGKDIVSGRVQLMFAASSGALQFARSGRVRILAVAATTRTSLLPGVPTMAEQGYPGFEIDTWLGWFGPAQMRPELVDKVNVLLRQALADPRLKERFHEGGFEAQPSSPAELAAMVKQGHERWRSLVRQVGPLK